MRLIPRQIEEPPANLDAFIAEIGVGVRALYGDAAARAYLERAPRGFGAAAAAPTAFLWGVESGDGAYGLLLGAMRGDIAEITLVHVLAPYRGQGIEHALVAAAVTHFQEIGVRAVVSEPVAHGEIDLGAAFREAGCLATERGLFMAATAEVADSGAEELDRGAPLGAARFRAAAEVIAAAYAEHSGRLIHPEVSDVSSAHEYLLRVLTGVFGPVLPHYCRVAIREGRCAGVLLGCELAPEVGFVLQVAVRPEFRGQGIAAGLLKGFAEAAQAAGVTRLGLGVTLDNPARRIYERAGFGLVREVTAFYWWRGGSGLTAGAEEA